jgi:hypothetical protein
LIAPKFNAKVWKAKTLELQALENQEKKTFDAPNFSVEIWNI